MDKENLSKRLQAVADFVPENAILADIGSDHAYLPIALLLQGKINRAVAGEVVAGPYESALKNVEAAGLSDKIMVRLADGLNAIEPTDEIDVITICGMGGQLIAEILERGLQKNRLTGNETLILQPNVGEYLLRKWLVTHQYKITAEKIITEDGKIYEIIVAIKSNQKVSYTEADLLFGFYLPKEKDRVFIEKWQKQQEKLIYVIDQLQQAKVPQTKKIKALEAELTTIKEMLT